MKCEKCSVLQYEDYEYPVAYWENDMTYEEAIKYAEEELKAQSDLFGSSFRKFVELSLKAFKKQIPEKPILLSGYYRCPNCGSYVEVDDNEGYSTEIYPACKCGKIIDWEGVDGVTKVDQKWLGEERFY